MKNYHVKQIFSANSRGAVLVLVSVLMVVFVGVAALALDIGYITTTKNELQNIADSAALAATGKLGQIYIESSSGAYDDSTDYPVIRDVAMAVGLTNRAGGRVTSVAGSDVEIGLWDDDTHTLDTTNKTFPNAVRVTVRRDTILNEEISSLFAGIFGIDSFGVLADAVAALTGQGVIDPGVAKLPIGLSEKQFVNNQCIEPIVFHSTNDSCAGWHIFDNDKINANAMDDLLVGMILDHADGLYWLNENYPKMKKIPDSYTSPEVIAGGTEFLFQGGTIASLFNSNGKNPAPIQALFDFWKERDDDGNPLEWTTTVPVYAENDEGECMNPNTSLVIVGAADIIVTAINPPPDNSLDVRLDCKFAEIRGGGGTGGTVGTIPNLVE